MLLTFGHGRLSSAQLGALLTGAGVQEVWDVRRFPGSRANPAAARGAVAEMCAEHAIGYRWEERLGGRRAMTKAQAAASPDTWWRVTAFRAYAAHTRTADFAAAMAELMGRAAAVRTAVMCSEALWWRCHRRLIADVAARAHGQRVVHLTHSGGRSIHVPSAGARLAPDGDMWWDMSVGETSPALPSTKR